MAQERALAESGRGADTPSTWVTEPMSTEVPSVDESNATTAAQPTNKTVQTERATPVAVDGATAIFVPAYTRTDDGNALEQVRDELTHLVGIYSEPDVRKQLGEEYDPYEITRAIERGERMTREHPDNATAAIRVAEKNEERGVDRGEGVATDGGEPDNEPGTKTVSGCATCSGYAYGGDDQCPECQQRGVEPVEEVPL